MYETNRRGYIHRSKNTVWFLCEKHHRKHEESMVRSTIDKEITLPFCTEVEQPKGMECEYCK